MGRFPSPSVWKQSRCSRVTAMSTRLSARCAAGSACLTWPSLLPCFAVVSPPIPIDSINLDLASADYFDGRASLWTALEMRSSVSDERPTAILGFDETFLRPFARALIEAATTRAAYRMTILQEARASERCRVVEYVTGPGKALEELMLQPFDNVVLISAAKGKDGDETLFEPRESIALTAEWLTRLRAAVGPAPVLGIDYHHRLSVAEAASFCQRMPRGTLDFLEEPIRTESPEAYAALRSMTDVPFAIGEEFASKWAFLPFIERGLTNFIRVDVCNVGGLTEAMKVAGWAEAHYVDLMPHNPLGPICTAATIHLAAAIPNFAWLEVRTSPTEQLGFDNSELFPVQPRLEGNRFPVSDLAGLGVEFDETKAAQQEFRFWEAPHLHRRDGSYTNW